MNAPALIQVTPEQVRNAALESKITSVDHHDCGGCGCMVKYLVHEGNLYFDSNCGCTRYEAPPRASSWAEAAEWINMQTSPVIQAQIMGRFGFALESKSVTLAELPFDYVEDFKRIWVEAGGEFHGPNIETGTMPQDKLIPFLYTLARSGIGDKLKSGHSFSKEDLKFQRGPVMYLYDSEAIVPREQLKERT